MNAFSLFKDNNWETPAQWRKGWRWFFAVFWILVGAILADAYNKENPLSELVALQVGMTAPLIVQKLIDTAPDLPPGSVE